MATDHDCDIVERKESCRVSEAAGNGDEVKLIASSSLFVGNMEANWERMVDINVFLFAQNLALENEAGNLINELVRSSEQKSEYIRYDSR